MSADCDADAEIRRLRKVIESGPHDINDQRRGVKACAIWNGEPCDCWKSKAAAGTKKRLGD